MHVISRNILERSSVMSDAAPRGGFSLMSELKCNGDAGSEILCVFYIGGWVYCVIFGISGALCGFERLLFVR